MKCPECGSELVSDADVCPGCGLPIDEETIHPRRRVRWPIVVLVLILVVGGGLFASLVIATVVTPNVLHGLAEAYGGKVKADIVAIDAGVKEYAIDNGMRYPDDLRVLVTPDEDGYAYLSELPLDPWGNEYLYDPPSEAEVRPRVYTLGSDGLPGGEGDAADVDNWSLTRDH